MNENEITINGETYVLKSGATWHHVCVIATNGWIFEGHTSNDVTNIRDGVNLHDAHVVRKWNNGLGVGAIAKADHKDDYTLDWVGSVYVHNVVAVINIQEW